MKAKLLSTIAFLFILTRALAQDSPQAGHIALFVFDMQKGADFYKNVMQLPVIEEPFHDGKHTWFRTGPHSQLHIIQGAAKIYDHDINTHIAYTVKDITAFCKHLDAANWKYGNWKGDSKTPQLRPDGVHQIYLQDPDGFWIEVNDDKF